MVLLHVWNRLLVISPKWVVMVAMINLSAHSSHAHTSMFSVIIPAPKDSEAVLNSLYLDRNDDVVMQYDLGKMHDDRVYFSNSKLLFDLSDKYSYNLANVSGFLKEFVSDHRLRPLESVYMGAVVSGRFSLQLKTTYASSCNWPYNSSLTVQQTGKTPVEVMFFRKMDAKEKRTYDLSCESGPGVVELTTTYENIPAELFEDSKGNVFIALRQPALVIRFNPDGTGIDLENSSGVFTVYADRAKSVFNDVAEGRTEPQGGLDEYESYLTSHAFK